MDWRPRCKACGDVIGVYEPMILLDAGQPVITSVLREKEGRDPRERNADPGDVFHHGCFPGLTENRGDDHPR